MDGQEEHLPFRSAWSMLAGPALALVIGLMVYAWYARPPPPTPGVEDSAFVQVSGGAPGSDWLQGLRGLTGVHLAEYRRDRLGWELWAPSANVRLQRYVFGRLRTRPLLHFVQPRAAIHVGGDTIKIRAQRVYFDPKRSEWIFVRGEISQGGRGKQFRQLHWFPDKKRLEWPKTNPKHPLFRFWEPLY